MSFSRIATRTSRRGLATPTALLRQSFAARRFESSTPQPGEPVEREVAPSPREFYKQFTRPFAKVFLMAMLTYQILYWGWEKLRLDELRAQKNAEVRTLEATIADYEKAQTTTKRA